MPNLLTNFFLLLTDFFTSIQTFLANNRPYYSTTTHGMNIYLRHGHLPTNLYPPFCPRSSHLSLRELITNLSTFYLFFLI